MSMTTLAQNAAEVVANHSYQRHWLNFEILRVLWREQEAGAGKSKERKRLQKELVRLRAARKAGQVFYAVE